MNFIKTNKETILGIIVLIGIIAGFIVFMCWSNSYGESSVTKEYSLNELDDGIYGIYTVVTSSIPAQNYEMITLCVNGVVCTFKGNVNIHYSNKCRLVWEDKNYINSDILDIYVPSGTIEYSQSVGIGSRRY